MCALECPLTLFEDTSCLDDLRSSELLPYEGDIDINETGGPLLLFVPKGGVRTGQGTRELVGELWQDAADEPLPGLPQSVHQVVLETQRTGQDAINACV